METAALADLTAVGNADAAWAAHSKGFLSHQNRRTVIRYRGTSPISSLSTPYPECSRIGVSL